MDNKLDLQCSIRLSIDDRLSAFEKADIRQDYLIGFYKGTICGMIAIAQVMELITDAEVRAYTQRADEISLASRALLEIPR